MMHFHDCAANGVFSYVYVANTVMDGAATTSEFLWGLLQSCDGLLSLLARFLVEEGACVGRTTVVGFSFKEAVFD